jgi:hypothetical protein
MRSNPVFALIALILAGALIKLTWGILSQSRGEILIRYGLVFVGLVFAFKFAGFLIFWAVLAASVTFPLALLAYAHFKTSNDSPPES